jgi:hypothetical protein
MSRCFRGRSSSSRGGTDEELRMMIDFLERGREMVEQELEKLEREE